MSDDEKKKASLAELVEVLDHAFEALANICNFFNEHVEIQDNAAFMHLFHDDLLTNVGIRLKQAAAMTMVEHEEWENTRGMSDAEKILYYSAKTTSGTS